MSPDCKVIVTIVKEAYSHPFPLLIQSSIPVDDIQVFPNASGEWNSIAGLGIYVPQHDYFKPLVVTLWFPYNFLEVRYTYCHWTVHKTMTL